MGMWSPAHSVVLRYKPIDKGEYRDHRYEGTGDSLLRVL